MPPTQPLQVPTLEWRGDRLDVIDQTLLPGRLEVRSLRSVADVVGAIKTLVVRGAPAIGVCGAFGVVLGLQQSGPDGTDDVLARLDAVVHAVGEARPTAANLAWAAGRVAAAARKGTSAEEVRRLALDEALGIRDRDVESCRRIGEAGRIELAGASCLLTHCNTGRLCAAGIGTALGVVYAKAAAGEPVEVIAGETRPLLQGSRLTAWELAEAGIPVTVIPDAAAGAALAAGKVDAVVVGCDRVACNGDTANKIGTYGLALLALAHEVAFYVAGQMTSFDPATAAGEGIVIEQRPGDEVRPPGCGVGDHEVAVWNPAFDVTPAALITGFITDVGVLRPPYEVSIPDGIAEAARLGLREP
jgi:methylthioribose-1-phosphate isomerase